MNLNPDEVYQEMVKGILPGVKLVPSGVWALGNNNFIRLDLRNTNLASKNDLWY